MCVVSGLQVNGQKTLFMPENIRTAYENGTRSMDGKPGKNYWQNTGHYSINVSVAPPSKTVTGTETITYINNSPTPIKTIVFKLIMNIHHPGAVRQQPVPADYLTTGIHIDQYSENGKELPFKDPGGSTWSRITLSNPVPSGGRIQLGFKWHYDLSEQSGREGNWIVPVFSSHTFTQG